MKTGRGDLRDRLVRWGASARGLAGIALVTFGMLSFPSQARELGEHGVRGPGPRVDGSQGNLSSIGQHTCAVGDDGTVQCWGSNLKGQLGDGTRTSRSLPLPVSGLANAVAVAVGSGHSCALRTAGTVACWGLNDFGQLGDGTRTDRLLPVTVSGLTDAVSLGVGESHTCAVRATGAVQCWGMESYGKLGNRTTVLFGSKPLPLTVAGVQDAVAVAPGNSHTCALRATGGVVCWGNNFAGQIGNGTAVDTPPVLSPTPASGLSDAIALAAGGHTSCAVRATGAVMCWGSNFSGVGGVNPHIANPIVTPTLVSGLPAAVAVAVGDRHTCASRADGTVWCWGGNSIGQLGNGTITSNPDGAPPAPVGGLADVASTGTGGAWTCARRVQGSMACWGRNAEGQLGDGTAATALVPTAVSGLAGSISARDLLAGRAHTCAQRSAGTAACWGKNDLGQLGNGSVTAALLPAAVHDLIDAGGVGEATSDHACVRRGDGTVSCWGDNDVQQTGDHFTGALYTPTPFAVVGVGEVTQVATGELHSCALKGDGNVLCWGGNAEGQLGSGTTDTIIGVPYPVQGLTGAIAIGAGVAHTCALRAGGRVSCWGRNSSGQLGDGTSTQALAPVPVSGLTDAVAIALGAEHTCALRATGTLLCWGKNSRGQLGNGTLVRSLVPSPVNLAGVLASGTASALAAGAEHTCAVLRGSQVTCWGDNSFGQFGDGTTVSRSAPATVVLAAGRKLQNVGGVTAGANHTCALRGDGQPLCWGQNGGGQLGDNSTKDRLSAIEVPSFRFNVDPAATLGRQGRIATVTALVNCPEGQHVQVRLSLSQGGVSGEGVAAGACTGGLARFEVTLPSRGRAGFAPGPAQAEAEAVVRDAGQVVDTQRWARAVELVFGP